MVQVYKIHRNQASDCKIKSQKQIQSVRSTQPYGAGQPVLKNAAKQNLAIYTQKSKKPLPATRGTRMRSKKRGGHRLFKALPTWQSRLSCHKCVLCLSLTSPQSSCGEKRLSVVSSISALWGPHVQQIRERGQWWKSLIKDQYTRKQYSYL